jgi:hypothetical protein
MRASVRRCADQSRSIRPALARREPYDDLLSRPVSRPNHDPHRDSCYSTRQRHLLAIRPHNRPVRSSVPPADDIPTLAATACSAIHGRDGATTAATPDPRSLLRHAPGKAQRRRRQRESQPARNSPRPDHDHRFAKRRFRTAGHSVARVSGRCIRTPRHGLPDANDRASSGPWWFRVLPRAARWAGLPPTRVEGVARTLRLARAMRDNHRLGRCWTSSLQAPQAAHRLGRAPAAGLATAALAHPSVESRGYLCALGWFAQRTHRLVELGLRLHEPGGL